MFSNSTNKIFILISFCSFFVFPSTFKFTKAKQVGSLPELKIIPTKCVSLQQEQVCYVKVTVVWQVSDVGDYCLYSSLQNSLPRGNQLQCWLSTNQGTFSQELEMTDDIFYILTDTKSEKGIISNRLPLAWVHKKEKFSHSSWRVF